MKKFVSFVLIFLLLLPNAAFAAEYDEEAMYYRFYKLYPDFIDAVKKQDISDRQIISLLTSAEENLLLQGTDLTEDNFMHCMRMAFSRALNLRKHFLVRNAISAAYPDATSLLSSDVIPEEFIPLFETVKNEFFGIKAPVVTISTKTTSLKIAAYAHSINLPDNCRLVLCAYKDNTLIGTKYITPNIECDPLVTDNMQGVSFRLFAWDNLTPLCNPYSSPPLSF